MQNNNLLFLVKNVELFENTYSTIIKNIRMVQEISNLTLISVDIQHNRDIFKSMRKDMNIDSWQFDTKVYQINM